MAKQTVSRSVVKQPSGAQYVLAGNLVFDYGLPASGITVRLYDVGFGGKTSQLGKDTVSDDKGNYSISYTPSGDLGANLELRALDPQKKEVILSKTRFNAQPQEILNLVVPASVQPLAPEYQRLAADMDKYAGGIANLGEAQENPNQQDLTLLYQSTGWDARVVALAATAAQQAKVTGLGQDVLYALYRAGLPTDANKLALLPADTIGKALQKASQSGIGQFSASQVASAQKSFTTFASKARLNLKANGAISSFNDLLGKTFSDPNLQNSFLDLYFNPSLSGMELWQKAAAAGIPDATITALKLQGKLSFLTYNNAKLSGYLQQQLGSGTDVSRLADHDYHSDATWKNALNAIAGSNGNSLSAIIPGIYGNGTEPERLEAYSADLARKVRISYPNRVVARMVETNQMHVPEQNAPNVAKFLRAADDAGYQLGKTGLNSFLNNPPKGVSKPDKDTAEWVKTLHRVYQITPSNESMQEVLRLGFTSARDIASFTPEEFQAKFGAGFPSAQEASLVYRKAQQVSSVVFNLYHIAKQLDNQPPIYALSDSQGAREAAQAAITSQFPSMNSLFGSLDFCECDDCRSVLSPAAYLVDILHFLDPKASDWTSTTAQWQQDHGNTPYPFGTPYSVLTDPATGRRPDLPNLNLSCENTNTALPYIDVVNEILEYYAANGQLDGKAAYDTGSAQSADLIAEPQNILPKAYSILANRVAASPALYPLGLPFDLWIETVRGFLAYFKMPLDQVLDAFRPGDPLELFSDSNHYPYYRASIFAETLGISPAEYALYTDVQAVIPSSAAAPQDWYKFYGYADPNTALSALGSSAKNLAQRLGVTYQDLADLVQTGFINPALSPLAGPLTKYGLGLDDVFNYTSQTGYPLPGAPAFDHGQFESKLAALMQQYYPQADPNTLKNWLNGLLTAGYSNKVLVLRAPAADPGDFQDTGFLYAGGNQATPLDFLKMNFFVRLWKKLGWSMDEVDQALQAFLTPLIPAGSDASFGTDFSKAMASALAYLAHLQDLFTGLQPGPFGRNGILPIWTSIPTTGEDPLYAQLFLTPAVLNNDPVFDDPTGSYLSGGLLVKDHLPALQGALGLAAADVEAVLQDNSQDVSTASLNLPTLSLLYRYALMSQGLQMTVPDFIALKNLTGLSPFQALKNAPLGALADDYPWTQTLQFVQQALQVQQSGFTVGDLDYLLRQKVDDPAGAYAQAGGVPVLAIKALAASIHAIQSQNAVPSDPTAFTDDMIRQKTSQVFPASVAQIFMGMWSGTIQYILTASSVAQTDSIPSNPLPQEPEIQLSYDPVTSTQTLVFSGVPVSSVMSRLSTAITGSSLSAHQKTLFQNLLTQIQTQALGFFQSNLQLTTGTPSYGFLPPTDFDLLFTPIPASDTPAQQQTLMNQKRGELAAKFLPYLQKQLIDQAVIQAQTANLGASLAFTKAVLTNTAVLADPTQSSPTPLLAALEAAGDSGVTATYYSDAAETAVLGTAMLASADSSLPDEATGSPKPAGVNSLRFEGYLEVPSDGPYNFTVLLPNNTTASATLSFDFLTTPLTLTAGTPSGSPTVYPFSGFSQFQAGVPFHFTLDVQGLTGGDVKVLVQGESMPQGPLSSLALYPQSSVMRYTRSSILAAKTFQLAQGFSLDPAEVAYLGSNPADFGNLSFSSLPTQVSDDSLPKAQALFGQFLRLANYGQLRKGPGGNTDGLIALFQNARQTIPAATPLPPGVTSPLQLATNNFFQTLSNLTRRDTPTLQATLTQLWGSGAIQSSTVGSGSQAQLKFTVPALVNDLGFARLWQALQMVQTLGVQPSVLGQLTGIVYPSRALPSASPDPGAAIAQALRNAVKARYTSDNWRPVAQSVFDPLRQKKRDALCAYILTLPALVQFGAVDTNGLFEYFLVDPGMEPVVQTSRIRLALSSVQTFIQRCLLNLEPQVKPSVIDSNEWEWMKRYRVWQANREIFLWPENWLIPEFRENATDLFQALQSALLQGDVTSDLVEAAYTDYLQGLDERARLDIVTMFNQPAAPGDPPGDNVLHIIGRNHGRPQKYFYRTFSNGVWTGWVPVTVDLEGDHIAAVIWRGRLCLFWLTFLIQGGATTSSPTVPSQPAGDTNNINTALTSLSFADLANQAVQVQPPTKVQVQLNWSEYYQGKWTTRKSSDVSRFKPLDMSNFPDFDPNVRAHIHASVETDTDGNEVGVQIHLDGPLAIGFRLTGKNAEPDYGSSYFRWDVPLPFDYYGYDASKYVGYDAGGMGTAEGSPQLQAELLQQIEVDSSGNTSQYTWKPVPVLQKVNSYNLLTCDNLVLPPGTSDNYENMYAYYMGQVAYLSSPFFYEDKSDRNTDRERTFFVMPNFTQTTTPIWDGWVLGPAYPDWTVTGEQYWNTVQVQPQVPSYINPNPPDPEAIYNYSPNTDWVASESALVTYGTTVVGREGGTTAPIQVTGLGIQAPSTALGASVEKGAAVSAGVRVVAASGLGLSTATFLASGVKATTAPAAGAVGTVP